MIAIRRGLSAFGRVRSAAHVMAAQLSAWALQAAVCYVTLLGLGRRASVAAAAVLVAVNVTAVVPLTPSIGVFQAACIAVLAGFGVSATRGLAYGLVLQAVEIAVDLGLGVPALRREGASFDDIRGGARMTGGRRAEPQPPPPWPMTVPVPARVRSRDPSRCRGGCGAVTRVNAGAGAEP